MAVTAVVELFDGRGGSADNKGVRSYTRVFRAFTDNPLDDAKGVLDGAIVLGLPPLGSIFSPKDPQALATRHNPAQRSDTRDQWDIRVEYSSDTGTSSSSTEPDDPLDRPPTVQWDSVLETEAVDRDINGDLIVQSAGEQPDPLPERDAPRAILRITRNEAFFDPTIIGRFLNKVNDDAFAGALPGEAKIQSIKAQSRFEDGKTFAEVTYEIYIRPDGWGPLEILNQGFNEIVGGELRQITRKVVSENGQLIEERPVQEEALLTFGGAKLPVGGTPTFSFYTIYEGAAFADLGLPNGFIG